MIHPTYYDACDVSCDVIYYVIAVRARRMIRIFFLPYLDNLSKSDPCSYEVFCLESHILSFPKVLQIPPGSLCISKCNVQSKSTKDGSNSVTAYQQDGRFSTSEFTALWSVIGQMTYELVL